MLRDGVSERSLAFLGVFLSVSGGGVSERLSSVSEKSLVAFVTRWFSERS